MKCANAFLVYRVTLHYSSTSKDLGYVCVVSLLLFLKK
jgi:hypothetical protein